jgi:hypothetical protein
MTRLAETLPTPSTPLKPASTAEVHAPQLENVRRETQPSAKRETHVIPSTLRVVVAICAVGAASDPPSPGGTWILAGAI